MLRTTTSIKLGVLSSLAVLTASAVSFAQDPAAPAAPAEEPAPAAEPAPVEATASADVGVAMPAAAEAAPGGSDHDQMAGRLGIGYLGTSQVSLRALNDTTAPVVGVRYWLDSFMGIDAGLGFMMSSGSNEVTGTPATDAPSSMGFILHGGVPLSLASEGHFSFQIVPELNLGFASGTNQGNGTGGADTDWSGFHLDLGARAGSEIQFGFIGIPQLALQAGIGLAVNIDSFGSDDGTITNDTSATNIGTTLNGNPWAIFTNSITALYYF
jgi:hypothetical protein